ncbi:Sensory/regulatory protein RpfC [Pirellulimonas nuda]|uniref:histidine kinase n=1 Tax=Pirellulimonas nuda TaxID=2528009 RepID=A0A518DG74_9BACT|nr:response regulator [Pirellulimonas nuda]QDU90459.1 Sensory/regulatory protein RpfC [Pirellulimonas nuda]
MKTSDLLDRTDAALATCALLLNAAAAASLLLAVVGACAVVRHDGTWVMVGIAIAVGTAILAAAQRVGAARRQHALALHESAQARLRVEASQAVHDAHWADTQHELRSLAILIQNAAEIGGEPVFGDAAASMLRALDDFAAKAPCPQRAPFDVRRLIERVVCLVGPSARAAGLRFEWRIDPATPTIVVGDEAWIRQTLLGLLSNALKYTQHGAITLGCELAATDSRVALLCFEVADTGPGIPVEDRARVFERGFRSRADLPGAGLGLAIARSLVDRMEGRITLESRVGAGSRFTVELPLAIALGPAPADAEPLSKPWIGARVLVVEDDEVNRTACHAALLRLGCEASLADSGEAGLRALAESSYDAVLLDIQMPRMDGYETARRLRLREQETGAAPTPIVAFTAHATQLDRQRCLSAGMNGFVVKPVRPILLARELSRVLDVGRSQACEPSGPGYDLDLVDCFLKHAPNETASLSQAIAKQQPEEVRRLAHLLQGQAANFGHAGCRHALGRLEDAATAKHVSWPTLQQLAAESITAVDQLRSALVGSAT